MPNICITLASAVFLHISNNLLMLLVTSYKISFYTHDYFYLRNIFDGFISIIKLTHKKIIPFFKNSILKSYLINLLECVIFFAFMYLFNGQFNWLCPLLIDINSLWSNNRSKSLLDESIDMLHFIGVNCAMWRNSLVHSNLHVMVCSFLNASQEKNNFWRSINCKTYPTMNAKLHYNPFFLWYVFCFLGLSDVSGSRIKRDVKWDYGVAESTWGYVRKRLDASKRNGEQVSSLHMKRSSLRDVLTAFS